MNVGISVLATSAAHIWGNGANQNLAFLVMLLRHSPWVENIYLVNGGDSDSLPTGMDAAVAGVPLVRPQDVTHSLDVMIEMGAQSPVPWLHHVRALGAKVVLFLVGQAYSALIENPIFGHQGGVLFNGAPWHEVWLLPQHTHSGMPLMRTLARVPVYEMPHIWSPVYLGQQAAGLGAQGKAFGFGAASRALPRPGWRVGIFEPNLSVVKNATLPLLACEHACRLQPDAIERVMAMNTVQLKDHPTFNHFASRLDITRQGKASYEPRLAFAECMAEFGLNAVVAHHWECGLNYAYYDALHGGYPLVHNADALRQAGVGLYYPGFSATAGGQALLDAWDRDPGYWQDYQRTAAAFLARLAPEHRANVDAFMRRLQTTTEGSA